MDEEGPNEVDRVEDAETLASAAFTSRRLSRLQLDQGGDGGTGAAALFGIRPFDSNDSGAGGSSPADI